ncbi:unnamed protein product [Hermetia illucens]|uniref:BHLH domain-containing protein n=2 Tax=Hermetia illucens TaxID=343691 RepID=A0A7R8UVU2_HERIL|nr:unnamed protein product [Hermetia illucens]
MPDPDDPNLEKEPDGADAGMSICTAVQRYVPQSASFGDRMIVTSRVEIETTLAKLFKCMNLAYSQKLTSPKWNHFRGVRLRWKDKIRLNNVIWRCWHMQFFLKKRTPVCQFASPLDVDIHSNPQTVVLEGKYWKRQLSVIQAEYRKWRRNFKSNAIGTLICDSKSEFDFSELLFLNDPSLINDVWANDSLFSTLNVPFPFPDSREIARDAGRADFIQPTLGALQPNIEDINLNTFHELLNVRLPTVPEDDVLRTVEFLPIMGSEQMDSANIEDVTNNPQHQSIGDVSLQDTNMLEMSTTGTLRFTGNMDIDQNPAAIIPPQNTDNQIIGTYGYRNQLVDSNESQIQNTSGVASYAITASINNQDENQASMLSTVNHNSGHNGRHIFKDGRVTKPNNRNFRKREPINYDRTQPTSHQTYLYQQVLAEQKQQQKQHQQQQQHANNSQVMNTMQYSQQFSNASVLSAPGSFSSQPSNIVATEMKSFSFPQQSSPFPMLHQNLHNQSEIMSILNSEQDAFKSNLVQQQTSPNSSFPVYNNMSNFKKAASTAGYILQTDMQLSPSGSSMNQFIPSQQPQQQPQQIPQQLVTKEMYRSNSLPLNSSLPKFPQKEDNFAVPVYTKHSRSRTRSNSMQQTTGHVLSTLQPATSEPMLNKSTLAQLLTSSNNNKLTAKQSTSTSAIASLPPSGFSPTFSSSNNLQPTVQTTQLTQTSVIQQHRQQHVSPTRNVSIQKATVSAPSSDNKVFNFSGSSLTPTARFSPESFPDPGSPLSPTHASSASSQLKYPRDNHRRAGHIHAEQKRRGNIKNGFDMLHSLIPQLQQNPNPKLSKAATLQKAAEYIKQLRTERNGINEKIDALRKERDALNSSLLHLQSILPANGAPVSRQRTEQVKQLYNQYILYKTKQNWKFWILGLILEPLINSYTSTVSVASIEELYRTALLWVDQHCSLVELRPAVSNKLRYLSTTTDILSDPPSSIEEEVLKAVNNKSGEHPNLTTS